MAPSSLGVWKGSVIMTYLFKTDSMSPSTVCRERLVPFTAFLLTVDAPLERTAISASERFRLASDGDDGAGGRDGGVRVPLVAAMMVMEGAVCDAEAMRLIRATRSGPSSRRVRACTLASRQPTQHTTAGSADAALPDLSCRMRTACIARRPAARCWRNAELG